MGDPGSASADIEAFRKHSRLFELLDEPGARRLLAIGVEEEAGDGHVFMREGEDGVSFYVVLNGQVRVLIEQDGEDGPKEVARLGQGAFVGEIGALMGEQRSATVIAVGEIKVLRFDSPPVQDILADYPKVREALVKLALKRSEDNLQQLIES